MRSFYLELYNLVATCYCDETMEFCPILIEVVNENLAKNYNGHRY